MKLSRVRVRDFRSIHDTGEFEVGQTTCLVGKNEAGKTAVLQALYRLNPIVPEHSTFDTTEDYPKSSVEDYLQDIETGRRGHSRVVSAVFKLEADEIDEVKAELGPDAFQGEPAVDVSRGYERDQNGNHTLWVSVNINEPGVVEHLCSTFGLPDTVRAEASSRKTLGDLLSYLTQKSAQQADAFAAATATANEIQDEAEKARALEEAKGLEESEPAKQLRAKVEQLHKPKSLSLHVWRTWLSSRFPRFLYFDEYYQLEGCSNISALKQRRDTNALKDSDRPLLGLIDLARLDLDAILGMTKTQQLKNKLRGASNHLTQKVISYWSQNKHVRMAFDVREGMKDDPDGMRTGMNIWGEIDDTKRMASTSIGSRSRGFVWFFSFLAWYESEKKREQPLVLLLDEPGLSLHGKAQEDLLRYFEEQINDPGLHQLVYTTHSPFMVDPAHFDRVRIVQDRGIDTDQFLPPEEDGTKVFTEVLHANDDTLFPLQGALGYEIYQTLFVGLNCLIVEGVSDLLYLQTMSAILESKGRTALDPAWTISPVGGADKVPTFVALLRGQKGLKLATLLDFEKSHQHMLQDLTKKRLLKKKHLKTYADFINGANEADVEDMFEKDFYLKLYDEEFQAKLSSVSFTSKHPRIVKRIEARIGHPFNHYRPARYFAEDVKRAGAVPEPTLARFEAAFKALNDLL